MSDIAIKFENISKQYRLGKIGTGTLNHDLKRWFTVNVRGKEDPCLKIGQENILSATGDRQPQAAHPISYGLLKTSTSKSDRDKSMALLVKMVPSNGSC
jgi:hypothetical protein